MDQATQPRTIGHGVRPVADNVWIVDAGRIKAAGLPLPIRMTVIRLSSGDLLLHSPTRFSHALRPAGQLSKIGLAGGLGGIALVALARARRPARPPRRRPTR